MHLGPIIRAMKHSPTRVALIIVEVAVTLAIVTNCINVILDERAKIRQPSGFDDANIVRVEARPYTEDYQQQGVIGPLIDEDLRELRAISGVRAASNTWFQPWDPRGSTSTFHRPDTRTTSPATQIYYGTEGFFETLGVTITQGRGFQPGDHSAGSESVVPSVAVISRNLADVMFPEENAVGKVIRQGDPGDTRDEPVTIVGVIDHFHRPFIFDDDGVAGRVIFIPMRTGSSRAISYLIRTEPGAMAAVIPEVEKRLLAVRLGRVLDFETVEQTKGVFFAGNKLIVATMTFIIVALVGVTALGLIGLTALSVSERTRQIGTRRALGATRADVVRHFLAENALITMAGLILGVATSYGLNYLLVTYVIDLKLPWELVAFGTGLLLVNAVVATVLPAMRAARISPVVATRSV
jgi:putative ABC transport system permease protein